MGEQLKGEATAHLQDDSTFVLKPVNPFNELAQPEYHKEYADDFTPIPTTNTNLKEGEVVRLEDYLHQNQYYDVVQNNWINFYDELYEDMERNNDCRTVLVLKEKKEQPSKLSDEREKDDNQQGLCFKLAELLDQCFHITYPQSTEWVGAYEIESQLRSMLETLNLKLVIHPTSNQ